MVSYCVNMATETAKWLFVGVCATALAAGIVWTATLFVSY